MKRLALRCASIGMQRKQFSITNVTVTFYANWSAQPVWNVIVRYDRAGVTSGQRRIIGYEVAVYVNNGQIAYK